MRIISGGQSGVDRSALDFALENNISCGGWCPKGRLAEDGPIDKKYPLVETGTSIYVVRTRMNVDDSDGTLVLFSDVLGSGSEYTIDYSIKKSKPNFIANVTDLNSINTVVKWVIQHDIESLNIAGPRESTSPGIYSLTKTYLKELFAGLSEVRSEI